MIATDAQRKALDNAVLSAGSQSALAQKISTRQQNISRWINDGNVVPAEFVIIIEQTTGVSRHDLRPDIYPKDNIAS